MVESKIAQVGIMKGLKTFWAKYQSRELSGTEFLLVCYWWVKNKRNREQITVKVIGVK